MQTIRFAANRRPSSYRIENDRQFKSKMFKYTPNLWGSIDAELWLLYVSSQAPMTTRQLSTLKCCDYYFRGSWTKYPCLYLYSSMYRHKTHHRIYCKLKGSLQTNITQPNLQFISHPQRNSFQSSVRSRFKPHLPRQRYIGLWPLPN